MSDFEQKKSLLKRWNWKVIVLCLVGIIILTAASVIGWGYWQIAKSVPQTKGDIVIAGLTEEVTVWRDEQGVPHIEAMNERDLYIAQGFVTAQDRMFQMDLSRRQASGMLSEVVGEAAIERDRYFRTFGLRRAAEASLEAYSEEALQILDWYAEGVNAYLEQAIASNSLPIEFRLMGYEPDEWTKVDSLTIGKFMAYDLTSHWQGQAFRYYLIQNYSEEKAFELFPSYPEDGAKVIQAIKENPLDIKQSFAHAHITHEFNGSNNWVLAGELTESGEPLLADDPHLGLGTPAIWYQTHLKAPEVNVSGVIFAGVPGIIIGHNEHIAWGVTNVGPDVQDLYIEKRNPDNPHEFLYNDEWEEATVYIENINVKDADPIEHEVIVTRHGPIISEFAHDTQAETALSMRWTALDPTTELEAVLMFNKATNWEEFKEALTYFHAPAQNFVFADQEGTIAYRANGLIPIRKNGDGLVPVPGWTDEYEWIGYIDWEELPTVVNPPEGFVATANNKIVDDSYPYHITHTWAQPYRQQRILDVLSTIEDATVENMRELQFDFVNLQAEEFVPIMLTQLNTDANQEKLRPIDHEAIQLLQDWNFVDDQSLGAPLLFHIFMQEVPNVLFTDTIDADVYRLFEGRAQVVDQLIRQADAGDEGVWMAEKGGLQNVTLQSFQQAVDKAVELQGDSVIDWAWGDFHRVTFEHPLASIRPLDRLFNPTPVPMGGSRVTVGAASFNAETGDVNNGAAWRFVADMSDLSKTYQVVGPGQSGHVLSPWYHDQIESWTTGQLHETFIDPETYRQTEHELRLLPE